MSKYSPTCPVCGMRENCETCARVEKITALRAAAYETNNYEHRCNMLKAADRLPFVKDTRGHFITPYINDAGDFYAVHLRMNGGAEEWHVTLRNNNGMELEHIALCASFDAAENIISGITRLSVI